MGRMSRHEPHTNEPAQTPKADLFARVGRALRGASRGLKRLGNGATGGSGDPIAGTLKALSQNPSGSDADPIKELSRHATALGPVVKRHALDGIDGVPDGLKLGWAQLPASKGRGFSLGLFTDRNHFAQIALADDKGRVFVGSDPAMDTHDLEPRFLLGKEGTVTIPDGPRLGHNSAPAGTAPRMVEAITGGVVGRDDNGRLVWLASWLKQSNRYTLEQLRADLPASARIGLEYRDAVATAFFAAYMMPRINGLLVGFGAGNIFRRLNREAPIGAIRRSIRDTLEARAHGMRASGLEDHFADLMREAGALDDEPGIQPVHGAEPLHLYTSSYSGCYFFAWNAQMAVGPALKALRIEGNLNRFAAVSSWLERNARIGVGPTEDTVTRVEAARIDMALLDNPALLALKTKEQPGQGFDPVHGDGTGAAYRLVEMARKTAEDIASEHPDPADSGEGSGSEWVYRQALSTLIRRLRLPYRFDAEFRVDLGRGNAAIAFTTAGASMMPASRYDEEKRGWRSLDDAERARMSADYNLRVGLIMAALAFGVDERVRQVSLHIDSIGLEEAVAEQDSAISELMGEALSAFERMRTADTGVSGTKADPKDGDVHGDPSRPMRMIDPSAASSGSGSDSSSDGSHDDESSSLDRQFEDLMRGADIDDVVFSAPMDGRNAPADAEAAEPTESESDSQSRDKDDPMAALASNPTVRNLVTVTLTRDAFLERLREAGLTAPLDTYRLFDATLDVDGRGALAPSDAGFDMRDARFSPAGSQEEPELIDKPLQGAVAIVLGADDATGLAIQRADLLQRAVADFHRIAADHDTPSVAKAQEAMRIIDRLADPELTALAPRVTRALIDGEDTPDLVFSLADELDAERIKARDLLFSGRAEQAFETAEAALSRLDTMFDANAGVPRYFNSYAERVVYNRLFATDGETTVLIPDNLFYAHMELADVLAQIKGVKAALPHLNTLVKYAPAYPLSHMKLAVQLARVEDWDSARAACLNALRVALDRDDAAFAYYRLAYAEWMQDRFATAAAAYIMSDHIAPGQIGALESELQELVARADSQCVPVPESVDSAAMTLAMHDLPVWPHTEVASIVRDAARVCVDQGMFVPARTLALAAARMNDGDDGGVDVVQAQFLRSLNA